MNPECVQYNTNGVQTNAQRGKGRVMKKRCFATVTTHPLLAPCVHELPHGCLSLDLELQLGTVLLHHTNVDELTILQIIHVGLSDTRRVWRRDGCVCAKVCVAIHVVSVCMEHGSSARHCTLASQ